MNDRPREVAVSRLLLDQSNARLGEYQPDQKTTQLALATLLDDQLFNLAKDIIIFGLDISQAFILTPEGASAGKYRVIEGNRRLLVIQALTKPRLIEEALTPARQKRWAKMSAQFLESPIKKVWSVIYEAEEDAEHHIINRHTGANNGAGLVGWNSNDQDRYKSRHGGPTTRKEAGQVLDFVDKVYPPSPEDNKRIFSTLQRIILVSHVKEKLGITMKSRIVYSNFPAAEVLKGLSAVVRDLRSGKVKVTNVYHAPDSRKYIDLFSVENLPDPATRLAEPVRLTELLADDVEEIRSTDPEAGGGDNQNESNVESDPSTSSGDEGKKAADNGSTGGSSHSSDGSEEEAAASSRRRSRVQIPRPRETTIPKTCHLYITEPRINAIYLELIRLKIDEFTNACAVTLRVFLELSVDHHITLYSLLSEQQRNSTPLAKRLKVLANYLRMNGRIEEQLEKAIVKVADGGLLSTSTTTFNQYVHNKFAYPHPSELRTAWDELQPFMITLWTK
jgi:hypothetical protein